ncbi:enoyl-CoA hydratase/isomerase family protein [Saccharopolyspora sp. 6V]|uniref:enoyl-CoA hydratase/isomerase family protein n=1 Tax=Saccharopolyspora sp. 6V TaxID=2877239 RepID=UPI001CD62A13|nr:enoyl-CoA hydratase/isomerase family protein [Saccharopolyspora sp. 6V]MCA1196068.1 enoyl-CoA hydratase/isomerase family protein [Saccharopolyspora sp. 6V]
MTTPAPEQVLLSVEGALGRITLNRPKAINSLTLEMVREMTAALQRWSTDEQVRAVLVEGAGERGLCAGGDIRALHDAAKAGDEELPKAFWSEEYRLNSMLAHYPKPVVGLMDGVCMGGGVGISAHGSRRVVTERSKVGMPEVGIGFVPDVGGTFLLSHAPGELGTHLALTGAPIGGADAVALGLADHHLPSERIDDLVKALTSGDVDAALARFATAPPESPVAAQREWIDEAYAADDVAEILARLRARPEQAAADAAAAIGTKSPTSLKVTLRALRSRPETLEAALDQEFRIALRCLTAGDFVEGVRATLVDKDRDPKWSPNALDEVTEEHVQRFFAPLEQGELGLSG